MHTSTTRIYHCNTKHKVREIQKFGKRMDLKNEIGAPTTMNVTVGIISQVMCHIISLIVRKSEKVGCGFIIIMSATAAVFLE